MTVRLPTREERLLWRESNRFTQKKSDSDEHLPDDDEPSAQESFETAFLAPLTATTREPQRTEVRHHPLKPMASREARRRLQAAPEIAYVLDLHGMTKLEAYTAVHRFIVSQYRQGQRHVLIITGKGRTGPGVLRTELPHWLNEPTLRTLISGFTSGTREKGGEGAMHVLLKKHHG